MSKILILGDEIKSLFTRMDNFGGSTSILKMEVFSSLTFLHIHIRVISAWSLGVVNTPIRLALDNPWMEEILNVSSLGKEGQFVGSYIANTQERQWQVSLELNVNFEDLNEKLLHRVSLFSDNFFDLVRILRGGIIDSSIGFRFERNSR